VCLLGVAPPHAALTQLRQFGADAAEPLRSRRFVDWLRVVARAGDGGAGCVRRAARAARRVRQPAADASALHPSARQLLACAGQAQAWPRGRQWRRRR
jgi:hypothetical protein